jgi:hypothetical protein
MGIGMGKSDRSQVREETDKNSLPSNVQSRKSGEENEMSVRSSLRLHWHDFCKPQTPTTGFAGEYVGIVFVEEFCGVRRLAIFLKISDDSRVSNT